MKGKLPTSYSPRSWKKRLQLSLLSALRNMLLETGRREWLGHDRMRLLDDTFETGLADGTLVKVRVKTEIVVTVISGTQPATSHSSLPTKQEGLEQTTDHNRRNFDVV